MVPSYDGDDTTPSPDPTPEPVVPDDDTVIPDDDTVIPDDDTVVPDDDTVLPDDDNLVPDDDTVVPDNDTVIPDEPVDPDTLPTPEKLYPEFSAAMDLSLPDCDWEAIEVTTDDGYILTLFHVWKADQINAGLGPIMFQHDKDSYAVDWITQMREAVYTFAHLGHHVYLGNNRGNLYSQGHV